jgi:uncharacterized RDD family membrane protein YckC
LIGVILLALFMSAPQLMMAFQYSVHLYLSGRSGMFQLPGLGQPVSYSSILDSAPFGQDQFNYCYAQVRQGSKREFDWQIAAIDPDTGTWSIRNSSVLRQGFSTLQLMNFGDRLWVINYGAGNNPSFEVVDDAVLPSALVPPGVWTQEEMRFLLNGEPAFIQTFPNGCVVSAFDGTAWKNESVVVLPDLDRDWMIGQARVKFGAVSRLTYQNNGSRIHTFLHVADGRCFHREGIELTPMTVPSTSRGRQLGAMPDLSAEPASALNTANTNDGIAGWSLVRDQSGSVKYQYECVVGGRPAVLFVDDVAGGNPMGHLFRLDGAQWTEVAAQPFPFGSDKFRVVCCRDRQKSYIVATTSTGKSHVYVWEETGVRATNGGSASYSALLQFYAGVLIIFVGALVLGIALGLGTWILMWWFTKPDYGFGNQTVKLASLGRRGLARLIDLMLIVGTTIGLGWLMTLNLDWGSLIEAANLRLEHPTVPVATRAAVIIAAWLAASVLSLLVVQGKWGITPGKWWCGLRTLRTTLRPCGFARSLVRETVLSIDVCSFLCWTPGILSIAFSDCRQRLGDLAAETVVVEVRSLPER